MSNMIRLDGVDPNVTTGELKNLLSKFGSVSSRIKRSADGKPTYAVVVFKSPEDATHALPQINGMSLHGSVVSASFASKQVLGAWLTLRAGISPIDSLPKLLFVDRCRIASGIRIRVSRKGGVEKEGKEKHLRCAFLAVAAPLSYPIRHTLHTVHHMEVSSTEE